MQSKVAIAIALVLFFSTAVTRTADAQIPTATDFAARHDEARHGGKAGTASPTLDDRVRADRARAVSGTALDFTAKAVESPDPQIHGIEAEGAKRAPYQAAYRSCMRRKGS